MKYAQFEKAYGAVENYCAGKQGAGKPDLVVYDEAGNKFLIDRIWVDGDNNPMLIIRPTNEQATEATWQGILAGRGGND